MSRLACLSIAPFIGAVVICVAAMGSQVCLKGVVARVCSGTIDQYVWQLQNSHDLEEKIQAASCLSAMLQRPTVDEVRKLSGVLRGDSTAEVRCAVAGLFGVMAGLPHYRVNSRRTQPEVVDMLNALREAFVYESEASVRVCIVSAAGEFNSSEAVVIIDRAKGDINQEVREAARVAERRREQRLRDTGQ